MYAYTPIPKKVHIGILYLCLKSTSYVPIKIGAKYAGTVHVPR